MLPLHGTLIVGQGSPVVLVHTKPPRGVPEPQLGTPSILFRMPLKSQDRVVLAQKGLTADQQLNKPPGGVADLPTMVLLQEK